MKLKDKVVVVTGSSTGIGEAIIYRFAAEGAKVVVNCKSNIEAAKKVVEKIKVNGSGIYIKADVTKPADVEKLFNETLHHFKTVDILINNAGDAGEPSFFEATIDDWIEVFKKNFFGTMLCSQYAAKIMRKNKTGKIINTASIRGLEYGGRPGVIAYSTAKAAVINFTKTLAKELSPEIQVNAVAPGFTYTRHYTSLPQQMKDKFINETLLKRWIKVEEIAEAFLFLAASEAITGHVLVVDAGWNLKF